MRELAREGCKRDERGKKDTELLLAIVSRRHRYIDVAETSVPPAIYHVEKINGGTRQFPGEIIILVATKYDGLGYEVKSGNRIRGFTIISRYFDIFSSV